MTDLTENYVALKAATAVLQKKLVRLVKKEKALRDEIKELHKSCTHEELEAKESYYGGSYDERASTNYWNRCTLCGATSKTTTITHSYYG
jgi:hypothetical protein